MTMAMLRRLHVLGSKDSTSQLLRSLSTRTGAARGSSPDESSPDRHHYTVGATGPPSVRRDSPCRGSLGSGNRGLCGLADTERACGGWSAPGVVGAVRHMTSAEPSAER